MEETEVIPTKHSIEEYLNDNPKCLYPADMLINKFHKFRYMIRCKRAKYWTNFFTNVTIIRYNHEALVISDNIIITYYRIISLDTVQVTAKINKRIHKILTKYKESKLRQKEIDKWNRQQLRLSKKYEKYDYHFIK